MLHAFVKPFFSSRMLTYLLNRRVFTQARGFTFEHDRPQDLYVSEQVDPFSCGLRTYNTLKTILLRINEAFHNGILNSQHYSQAIWAPLITDVQPGKY